MPGINTQIKYKGLSLHLQTQDKGASAKYIESLIYKAGKAFYSRKTPYHSLINRADFKQQLLQLMKKQHLALINDISDGKCDQYLNLPEKQAGAPQKSLSSTPAKETAMKGQGILEINLVQLSLPSSSEPLSFSLEVRVSSPSQPVSFSQVTARAITEIDKEYILFDGFTDEDGKLMLGFPIPEFPGKRFTLSIKAEKQGFEPEEIKIPLIQA
jgi:hypothetical protein